MMINNNLGSMQDADKASLPKKVTYARHYGKTQARELSSVPEKLQKPHRNQVAMLILELGIWIIPLIFAPCRRLVLLVAKLQQLEASIMHTRSSPPAIWSRIARIQTLSMTL
jgi:hypothetical protein